MILYGGGTPMSTTYSSRRQMNFMISRARTALSPDGRKITIEGKDRLALGPIVGDQGCGKGDRGRLPLGPADRRRAQRTWRRLKDELGLIRSRRCLVVRWRR